MSPPVASSALVSLAEAGAAVQVATTSAVAALSALGMPIAFGSPAFSLTVEIGDRLDLERTGIGRLQHEARGARRHQGVGRARLRHQRLCRLVVQPVNVVAKMDGAVARRPAGEIGPGDRNLVGQPNVDTLTLV